MKKRKLKIWVKTLLGGIVVALIIAIIGGLIATIVDNVKTSKTNEKELINNYISCLNDNFTQRDYCARELNSEYHYLDQLLKENGYKYEQKGYDLYLKKVGE